MGSFLGFLSSCILFFMLLSLFNLVRYMLKIRKVMQMHKDNPNIKGISIVNGEVKVIEDTTVEEKAVEETKELITDPICGQQVDKKEAYRILKDGKEYYFCSWDCREKFLNEHATVEGL